MKELLRKLSFILDQRQKRQAAWILVIMLLGAGMETLGVGIVFPVVNLIVKPDLSPGSGLAHYLPHGFLEMDPAKRVILASASLMLVFLVKNVGLALVAYVQSRFIFKNQVLLSQRLFRNHMDADYLQHLNQNSATVLRTINLDTVYLYQSIIAQLLTLVSETLVLIFIMLLLVFIDPVTTFCAVLVQGGVAVLVYWWVKGKISRLGFLQQDRAADMIKWVNQGLGGIKETKITQAQDFFIRKFSKNADEYAEAQRYLFTLNQMPRLIFEVLAVSTLTLIVSLFLYRNRDFAVMISTVAAFGMAAVRLMPGFTRILSALNLIRYYSSSVNAVYEDLNRVPTHSRQKNETLQAQVAEKRTFDRVEFSNVTFTYPAASRAAVDGLRTEIRKNSSVAFVGKSGAGKSTVVDILLGLLHPTSGQVLVDGRDIQDDLPAWQSQVGYVPQMIYLTDDTIRRNIAMGVDDEQISDQRIWETLASVQLDDFVRTLPGGLDSLVGERGLRISGGQRQRIGIARALYRDPEILVFDEATSALDMTTEREIMKAISGLKGKKTFVMIAHRLSTVRNCDFLYFMKDGKVVSQGRFEELCESNPEFKSMAKEAHLV